MLWSYLILLHLSTNPVVPPCGSMSVDSCACRIGASRAERRKKLTENQTSVLWECTVSALECAVPQVSFLSTKVGNKASDISVWKEGDVLLIIEQLKIWQIKWSVWWWNHSAVLWVQRYEYDHNECTKSEPGFGSQALINQWWWWWSLLCDGVRNVDMN